MKIREREPVRQVLATGARVFDLYDLMDRAGTIVLRFTKRYINIPLTAAATGLLGNKFGEDGFNWEKLIYGPLIAIAGICTVGVALKIPNMLNSAKRNIARVQGYVDMVQLKRHRRQRHARILWDRHFVYMTRQEYSPEQMVEEERRFLEGRRILRTELAQALSEPSKVHLNLQQLKGAEYEKELDKLVEAMECESPDSPGVENCLSAFLRTFLFSLRSEESQRVTQDRCGYAFRDYKTWLRRTFFDPNDPPLAAHMKAHIRLRDIGTQLFNDGVEHDQRVRQDWYVFPDLGQRFWHSMTTRRVSVMVGEALLRLSRRYGTHLSVQCLLWPGMHMNSAYRIRSADGHLLADELRDTAATIIRSVYGKTRHQAAQMLDRAMYNNFAHAKGARMLADYAYCVGEGVDQDYLSDLRALGCEGDLLHYHQELVEDRRASMQKFRTWMHRHHPRWANDAAVMAAIQDAFHRNYKGIKCLLGYSFQSPFSLRRSVVRMVRKWTTDPRPTVESILEEVASEEGQAAFQEDRQALRMFDVLAHLEYDTYRELIESLGRYSLEG